MADEEDLPAVAAIYTPYVLDSTATFEAEPPSLDDWRGRLTAIVCQGLPFLVAEVDREIVGYAYCTGWRTRAAYRGTVEDSVYVRQDARSRGLGTLLLRELLAACGEAQFREVIAVIADGAEAAASVALHRRCGFKDAGRLTAVGFKHGLWLDTLLMQHTLGKGAP